MALMRACAAASQAKHRLGAQSDRMESSDAFAVDECDFCESAQQTIQTIGGKQTQTRERELATICATSAQAPIASPLLRPAPYQVPIGTLQFSSGETEPVWPLHAETMATNHCPVDDATWGIYQSTHRGVMSKDPLWRDVAAIRAPNRRIVAYQPFLPSFVERPAT